MKMHKMFIFTLLICSSLFVNAGSITNSSLDMKVTNQTLDFKTEDTSILNVTGYRLEIDDLIDFNLDISQFNYHNEMSVINLDDLNISVNENKTEYLTFDTEYLTYQTFNDNMLNIRLSTKSIRYKPKINFKF